MAQLSAYLDQELAPDEITLCATHLHTCQPCQSLLADLRLTTALLHQLPQVEVPRSFVLPTNLVVLPTTPASRAPQSARQAYRGQSLVKRTLRTLSTIAAIVGLFFILAGVLTTMTIAHTGGTNTATLQAPNTGTAPNLAQRSLTAPSDLTPPLTPSRRTEQPSLTHTPDQVRTPQPTATHTPAFGQAGDSQQPGLPSVLDPSQPTGRLSIGSILLLLGILGILWTRRWQHAPTS
jgi:putative zinc finger protein